MAYRIIYTSAPRLLQAGRSGFGVVARHKEIPQDVVEFSERISQFSRSAGFSVDRVVYAYRVFQAPSGNWHIMSRISDAGASFTGRTNHLAEHLVVDEVEVQKIITAGGTPAGVMLAYAWPAFSGDSRWLSSKEAWEATAIRANPYGDKWAELCPDGDAKRRRLLSCSPGVTPQILFEYPDRLRTAAGAKEVLHLFAESESDCPKRGWGCAFTTDLQPSDNQADFQWIGLPLSSPLGASLKTSGRKLVDFRSPVPQFSVTKPLAAASKIVQKQPIARKVKSLGPDPRKRVAKSSWPTWLKVLLVCLGVLVLVAAPILVLVAIKLNPPAATPLADGSKAPQPQAALSSGVTDHTALPEVVPTPKPPPPPRQFEKTFLVRYVENQRPGMVGPDEKHIATIIKAADTEAAELFKINSSSVRVKYAAWRSDSAALQVLRDETGPVLSHKSYGLTLTKRGEAGRPPSEPLDLKFGLADSSQPQPLRIIELQPQSGTNSAIPRLPEVDFVVEAAGNEESVNVVDIKGNPDVAGLRSRSDEALVLRPARALLRKLVGENTATNEARNLAVFITPDDGSLPRLSLSDTRWIDLQWVRNRRKAVKDEADGRFPPKESSFEDVVRFLKGWQPRDKDSKALFDDLLGYFGEEPITFENEPTGKKPGQQPSANADKSAQSAGNQRLDPVPIFLAAAEKFSASSKQGAKKIGEILRKIEGTLDVSQLKEILLGELEERLRQENEDLEKNVKERQQQAQEIFNELFANGNSLLPAGDYILGLSHKGKDDKAPIFYPAMKVRISFDRNVEAQRGPVEGQKSLSRLPADHANALNSDP